MDGERRRDIDITFTECPFTVPLVSIEKVEIRLFSPSFHTLKKHTRKLYFSTLPAILPFVVFACSVLTFTMHPSYPSPPIYRDLALLND